VHIKINNCNLFFDVYGSKLKITSDKVIEKPTLIVLHGGHGMADHTLYIEFWSQFSDIAQVIFLDQRGCGRSDHRSAEEWNLKNWGEDLYQFCSALNIKNPIIAGVSMGGHVMCEYVSHYPEQPAGLIFCNTEARFVLDDVCAELERRGGKHIAELARKQFTQPTAEISAQYEKECVPYYAKNAYTSAEVKRCLQHKEVFDHFCKNEMQKFDYLNELSKIKCPTLLMVGADSPLHVTKRAEEMRDKINSEYVKMEIFKEAGAPVYKDKPEEAYQVIKEFLLQFANISE
jgi:pimeloyl-ACP methyl ester carboxylesterase